MTINRRTLKYKMVGDDIKVCSSQEWTEKFRDIEYRRIGYTETGNGDVSTVFLGDDHNFDGEAPVLFETIVFGGTCDGDEERYCTRKEAEEGHRRWVDRVTRAGTESLGGEGI